MRATPQSLTAVIGYGLDGAKNDDEVAAAALLHDFVNEVLVKHLVNRPAPRPAVRRQRMAA